VARPGARRFCFVCAGRSAPGFESGGRPARGSIFFACPKKIDEKKGHPKTCPSLREVFPARLALGGARELAPVGRSDTPRSSPPATAMLGGVNGNRVPRSSCGVPNTPWCRRAPQVRNRPARGLSDRAQRGSSAAPVLGRGAQGSRSEAQTKPWGAFSFAFFSLGKQRKEGRVRCAQRIQTKRRAARRTKHQSLSADTQTANAWDV